jgi:hypothetical protein
VDGRWPQKNEIGKIGFGRARNWRFIGKLPNDALEEASGKVKALVDVEAE